MNPPNWETAICTLDKVGIYTGYIQVAVKEWCGTVGKVLERLVATDRLIVLDCQLKHGFGLGGRAVP